MLIMTHDAADAFALVELLLLFKWRPEKLVPRMNARWWQVEYSSCKRLQV